MDRYRPAIPRRFVTPCSYRSTVQEARRTSVLPSVVRSVTVRSTAVHQLRQAPDYLDALSMPLPMHLASLAQAYVLPTRAEEDEETDTDTAGTATSSGPETNLASALGIIAE